MFTVTIVVDGQTTTKNRDFLCQAANVAGAAVQRAIAKRQNATISVTETTPQGSTILSRALTGQAQPQNPS